MKKQKGSFIMKKQKMWQGLAIGLCMLALTGCGTGTIEETRGEDMGVTKYQGSQENKDDSLPDGNGTSGVDASQENQNNATDNDTDEKVDAGSLYTSAAMKGSVVEFSDDSCSVSAAMTEDDGKTGVIAAPGYESEDENVMVTYQEGCVVQIATINTSTGIAALEQASVSDIKKQASVIIYGSFKDMHHVSANKIIICHWTS